ncbi:hypothetical protein B1B04_22300 [Lysinibacillus sp. KCTC 33748]|uniref:hypothetical protein n=1 Tax=unclassified Lysinibacillus TaxID=2636778 RepID=UPI0009A76DA2|nr:MULTISPECIES: hypothetical protein [unclassified Lysinibacillus]OXS67526.1 hypothetical protein B1B04_22300 [Lysinibacillus sp. KCTC 33748]SKC14446.1 hypothetical protein SAMN06295926_12826 [Lysinibacillus sp. AC-3]
MDAITELAVIIKNGGGGGASTAGTSKSMTTGIVISPPPNTNIQLNETITLDNEHLIFTETIINKGLINGDEVILIPTADDELYYVIDKAVKFDVT